MPIEIINNKARHNLIDAKFRRRSDRLDGAGSFWEPLCQTKVIQICQRETQMHQGAITHVYQLNFASDIKGAKSILSCFFEECTLRSVAYFMIVKQSGNSEVCS